MKRLPFWKTKSLIEMTDEEWERLEKDRMEREDKGIFAAIVIHLFFLALIMVVACLETGCSSSEKSPEIKDEAGDETKSGTCEALGHHPTLACDGFNSCIICTTFGSYVTCKTFNPQDCKN